MNRTMPSAGKLSDREVEICHRLRAYREAVQTPRSAFASGAGIGTERLASYENARAPLRWGVFTKLQTIMPIHPRWLATGRGRAIVFGFNLDRFLKVKVPPRKLFTEVYDEILVPQFEQSPTWLTRSQLVDLLSDLNKATDRLAHRPGSESTKQMFDKLADGIRELEMQKTMERHVNEMLVKRGLEMDLEEDASADTLDIAKSLYTFRKSCEKDPGTS